VAASEAEATRGKTKGVKRKRPSEGFEKNFGERNGNPILGPKCCRVASATKAPVAPSSATKCGVGNVPPSFIVGSEAGYMSAHVISFVN
jgi:hypothetical protein